jgi:hypothetical protein
MKRNNLRILISVIALVLSASAAESARLPKVRAVASTAEVTTYRGSAAIRVVETEPADANRHSIAIIEGSDFEDGEIEAEVVGLPSPGASAGARGFVGLAFRISDDAKRLEYIYLRPTNGRADDQLRRNHSTQYASAPDYPWHRLRKESPGVYESYTDMEVDAWTHMRIVVRGTDAWLYVNHAPQPCLIVHDLKLGKTRGAVALWIGSEAIGYFRNIKITPAKATQSTRTPQ